MSGQFFRQFAVTIAVSTIISAINALTMTPSRAVVIFQTEEGKSHESTREALPWWIFGVVGGIVTIWLLPTFLGAEMDRSLSRLLHVNVALNGDDYENEAPKWVWWAVNALYFLPGFILGLPLGWFLIRPVNAVLGWFFRGFNRYFDTMTAIYGRAVGKMLRLSAVVLVVYGGLLVLTVFEFRRTPTGFIPQQDKGYLLLNVQLPDSASVERTQRAMAIIEKIARGDKDDPKNYPGVPGVAHTVGVSGQSLILGANAPNLGSLYVMLTPFDQRHGSKLTADAIAAELQERCSKEVRRAIVSVFGAPPIDGLGSTGGFKLIIEDRANLGLEELQRISDKIVTNCANSPDLKRMYNSSGANTPWLYLEIDRTKCLTLGVQVSDIFSGTHCRSISVPSTSTISISSAAPGR